MTVTKASIVQEIASKTGFTKKDTTTIINYFIEAIIKSLERNDRIELREFGVFMNKKRKQKVGRNFKTGNPMELPARLAPVFKPSKLLKKKIENIG